MNRDIFFSALGGNASTTNNDVSHENTQTEDKVIRYLIMQAMTLQENPFTFLTAEHFSDGFFQEIFKIVEKHFESGMRLTISTMKKITSDSNAIDYVDSLTEENLIYNEFLTKNLAYDLDATLRTKKIKQKAVDFIKSIEEKSFYEINDDFETFSIEAQSLLYSPTAQKTAYSWQEMIDEFAEDYSKNNSSFFSTGFLNLDALLGGLHRGDLLIVGGRPAMGKTAFELNLIYNVLKQGKNVLSLSYEMTNKQTAARFLALDNFLETNNKTTLTDLSFKKSDVQSVFEIADTARKKPFKLLKNYDVTITINNLTQYAKMHAKKLLMQNETLDCIFIDYLQIMPTESQKNQSKNNVLGELTLKLKHLAKELNVPVVLLSQLNRELEKEASIDKKRPNMAHLRDSGSIEQDADVVLFPFRPSVYEKHNDNKAYHDNYMEIIVAKNRQGEIGIAKFVCDMSVNYIADANHDYDGKTGYTEPENKKRHKYE